MSALGRSFSPNHSRDLPARTVTEELEVIDVALLDRAVGIAAHHRHAADLSDVAVAFDAAADLGFIDNLRVFNATSTSRSKVCRFILAEARRV
jgi:hypothetical protein